MRINGFSLFEILITLILITTTCFAFLNKQAQAMKWSNQQHLVWQATHLLSNACERLKAGKQKQSLTAPFHWYDAKDIGIEWQFDQRNFQRHIECSALNKEVIVRLGSPTTIIRK